MQAQDIKVGLLCCVKWLLHVYTQLANIITLNCTIEMMLFDEINYTLAKTKFERGILMVTLLLVGDNEA